MNLLRPFPTAVLATLLAAGCAAPGASPSPSASDDATASASPSALATVPPTASVSPSASEAAAAEPPTGIPARVWEALLEDLAERVGRPVPDPDVVEAEARTWNDGSLGCPEPGMGYTQALVDGFRIVVEVDEEEFDYRSDGRGVRYCDDANAIEGGG